jgi:hypothetical protein
MYKVLVIGIPGLELYHGDDLSYAETLVLGGVGRYIEVVQS